MMKIGVLGTGTMGAGIIQVLAQNGYEVYMRARRQTSVDGGMAKIEKNLSKMVAKEKITAHFSVDTHCKGIVPSKEQISRVCAHTVTEDRKCHRFGHLPCKDRSRGRFGRGYRL